MTLIQPVSGLSIKRAVNLYTIILFLSFGALLYWVAADRYQFFFNSFEDAANNLTKISAFQINKTLKDKQRVIDIFVVDSGDLITELSDNPEDDELHQAINARLKKYQPDFIEFNIVTESGETIIGDANGGIGEVCLEDCMHYIKHDEQRIRLHTNRDTYHYDVISKYSTNNTSRYFIVSFNDSEISDLLKSIQPDKHNLMLVNKEANNLIEITSQGSRQTISDRQGFRMRGGENLRALSITKVKGTNWHVFDIHDDDLFSNYLNKIITEYAIVFYIFSIITLFMRHILINQDIKRTAAEEQLQKNHNQIKDLNNQLEQLSITDSLTGLYNRRYFDEIINQEWNRGLRSNNPLSCILLDIDYFKNYNDLYGHQAGDQCLKDISLVMKDTFRRAGDMVARYGGEEFIVLMSDTSKEGVKAAMTLFQQELEKLKIPHHDSDINEYVTISAGMVNQAPSRDESIESFIRKADKALYQAKSAGKNQWVMHEE